MKVNQAITKEFVMSTIEKNLSIAFPADDAYQFLTDTISNAGTLSRLNPLIRSVPAGNIDALTTETRKIRLADDSSGDTSTTADGVTKRQIPYAVKKVFWDTWLKNDDVVYNAVRRAMSLTGIGAMQPGVMESSDLETVVISLIQKAYALDFQDLMFNGDTDAATASDPDADFLGILDGFVKKSLSSSYITDIGTAEPTIELFMNHLQILPEKYKNNFEASLTWFIKRSTHDKLLTDLSSRQTPYGDAVIKDGKIQSIAGYPVEIVATLTGPYINPADYSEGRKGWACLTPWQNLTPVLTQDVKYNRTGDGATALKKDSTYHILHGYGDAVLRETDACAVMVGENL